MENFIKRRIYMGILETTNDEARATAENLISEALGLYNHMISVYQDGTNKFWKHPTLSSQQIADKLGNRGKELFLLHYQLGQLLNTVNPGCVDGVNSNIGNFTLNEDGTVTVI